MHRQSVSPNAHEGSAVAVHDGDDASAAVAGNSFVEWRIGDAPSELAQMVLVVGKCAARTQTSAQASTGVHISTSMSSTGVHTASTHKLQMSTSTEGERDAQINMALYQFTYLTERGTHSIDTSAEISQIMTAIQTTHKAAEHGITPRSAKRGSKQVT